MTELARVVLLNDPKYPRKTCFLRKRLTVLKVALRSARTSSSVEEIYPSATLLRDATSIDLSMPTPPKIVITSYLRWNNVLPTVPCIGVTTSPLCWKYL